MASSKTGRFEVKTLSAAACLLLFAVGCVSVRTDAEWQRVQNFSHANVGVQAQWIQTEKDDSRVQAHIQHLLADGMSSDDAVRIALMNNRKLQAVFEEVGIAKADLVQAGLFSNPNLSALLQFPFRGKGLSLDVGGFLNIADLWQIPLRKKLAAAHLDAALLRVNEEILRTAADAKKAFFVYTFARSLAREQQVLKDELLKWESHLTYREKFGFESELDLLHAGAAVREGKLRVTRLDRDLRTAEVQLLRVTGLIGSRPKNLTIIEEHYSVPVLLPSEESLLTAALAQRPILLLLRAKIAEAERLLALERAMIFKNVDVGGGYSHEPGSEDKIGPALSLQVPIFDQNQAQIAKSEYRKRQAEKELADGMETLREEISILYSSLDALRTELLLLRDEVLPLREKAVAFTDKYYNAMQISMVPFLEARQQMLESKLRFFETKKEYFAKLVELERISGCAIVGEVEKSAPGGAGDRQLNNNGHETHGTH
jgi:cobalt-zinc-cadmium efflux system outer membrane protein